MGNLLLEVPLYLPILRTCISNIHWIMAIHLSWLVCSLINVWKNNGHHHLVDHHQESEVCGCDTPPLRDQTGWENNEICFFVFNNTRTVGNVQILILIFAMCKFSLWSLQINHNPPHNCNIWSTFFALLSSPTFEEIFIVQKIIISSSCSAS